MKKITKPANCRKCPVLKETKKTIKCDVAMWEIKKDNKWEEYKKWANCPLDWDK